MWVGDSLFSKPRYEPMTLLAAISQRTQRVRLGTACLVTSMRNPLYTALEWATLDAISGGRMILGPCMGNPEEGVKREFAALGLPFSDRATVFEEGLEVINEVFRTGSTSFKGTYFNFDEVAFHSGTEMAPLQPQQISPPIWVVSNPRLVGDKPTEKMRAIMERACDRIVRLGDGWMTCCRAQHPEELTEQIGYLTEAAARRGRDFDDYTVAYQVTMNIGDSADEARTAFGDYISQVLPGALARDGPLELGSGGNARRTSPRGCGSSTAGASTTSSAASGRSINSGRSSASRRRCCLPSRHRK